MLLSILLAGAWYGRSRSQNNGEIGRSLNDAVDPTQ
jgi:hypothetical protein